MLLVTAFLVASIPQLGVWAVAVRGDTQCPTAGEVSERIGNLVSPQASLPETDWVQLRDVPAARPGAPDLEIQLVRAGLDHPVGVRRMRRGSSCSETADAAAVVAATWVGQYPTAPAALPALPESTSPQEGRPIAPAGPPPPADTAASNPSLTVARASAPSGGRAADLHVGLGASAGVVSTPGVEGSAGYVQIDAELVVRDRWLLRLSGAATGLREQQLGEGRMAWRRLLLVPTFGWAWRDLPWRSTRLFAEVGGGPVAALIQAQGQGFSSNASDSSLDVGLGPTVRFGMRVGRLPVVAWVGSTLFFWLRRHQIAVEGTAPAAANEPTSPALVQALPRWDLSLTAGLTFFLKD